MAETSVGYEKLTQEIYQILHGAPGFIPIKVEHNVLLKGKSGCEHQIDVYWEFQLAGETHKVAIECKHYSDTVSITHIRDFFGVLHDIGDIKGIMVTKVGYQSGAIKFAEYYSISLKELRFPTLEDWIGRVKTMIIDIYAYQIHVTNRQPIPDNNWLSQHTQIREGLNKISFAGYTDKILVYDNAGQIITNFYEMESKLPQNWKEEQGREYTYPFEDGYLDTKEFGRIRISKIIFTYDIIKSSGQVVSEGETIAKAILKDVKTGDLKFVDKNGHVK